MSALERVSASKHLQRAALLVPLCLLFLIFHDLGSFGFIWDDIFLVRENPALRSADWLSGILGPLNLHLNYFRPLVLASWVLDARLFEQVASGMHWSNLLIRGLNTLLVCILAQRFANNAHHTGRPTYFPALIAGALYAVHPALVESTVWISGRFDLLVTLVMLSGLVLANSLAGMRLAGALFAVFFMAALTKEYAVIFPGVLLFWLLAQERVPAKWPLVLEFVAKRWQLAAALAVSGAIYLLVRYLVLGYLLVDVVANPLGSPLQRMLMVGKTFLLYMRLTVWPFGISSPLHETEWPLSTSDPEGWLGLLCLGLACLAIWRLLASQTGRPYGWLALGLMVSYLPVLNFLKPVPIENNFAAERFMTFPLAMTCVAIGSFLATHLTPRSLKPVLLGVFIWVLPAALVSNLNGSFWRSDLYLWSWVIRENPYSPGALINLSAGFIEDGNPRLVLPLYRKALITWAEKEYPDSLAFLSDDFKAGPINDALLLQRQSFEKALAQHWDKARHARIFLAYPVLLDRAGMQVEALFWLDILERLEPDQLIVLATKGSILADLGRIDDAVRYIRKASILAPEKKAYANFLNELLERQARIASAK